MLLAVDMVGIVDYAQDLVDLVRLVAVALAPDAHAMKSFSFHDCSRSIEPDKPIGIWVYSIHGCNRTLFVANHWRCLFYDRRLFAVMLVVWMHLEYLCRLLNDSRNRLCERA